MQNFYNYGVDKLSYTDEGKGPDTLLLLHGFGEDNQIWKNQVIFLSKYFRVIAPNLPGVHCKPIPLHHSQAPTLNLYVELLHEFMHYLKIDSYCVIGHSMGGYIGLELTDIYFNHVTGLGLIHSTTYADKEAKKISRLKVAEFIQEFGTLKYLETATANLFATNFKKMHPEIIQDVIDAASDISSEAMIQFVMAMKNRKERTPVLIQKIIPVLMVVGEEDIAVPLEDSLAQTKLLSEQYVTLLHGVGHMGMLEDSGAVNQAIYNFLKK